MGVYHQIGHHAENLVLEDHLSKYSGAILSPVNYTLEETIRTITRSREKYNEYNLIFDPQLYYPRTDRDKLRNWPYFPEDVDTVDLSDLSWWDTIIENMLDTVDAIKPNTVCSPTLHPRTFDNQYFEFNNQITNNLLDATSGADLQILQTVLISLSDLSNYQNVMTIASLLTRTKADGIYLIFYSTTSPRRELNDPEELKGGMLLINILESNDIRVLVGFSSSEIILWKASGASSCASGKFFNLRRYTPSRWEEADDSGGRGQLPYLLEENLLASLRESDVARLQRARLFSYSTTSNPYFKEILSHINTGTPWISLGWKFYLYWFYNIEKILEENTATPEEILRNADRIWGIIEDQNILFEERKNNGEWIRQWLRALYEFTQPW